ncbi:MAG: PIN domain-containing protein [Eubacterium sp.]|nr:PIN domain-containing protein [Eubacterium sp.]
MKVLIDTCIIVDVLQKREPFYIEAMEIFVSVSNRQFVGVLTAKSVTDIYYILRRSIHNEKDVRKVVQTLFNLFGIEDTFSVDCQIALQSSINDYEDAVMVQTAKRIGADCIVTRNLKDYLKSDVPVLSPSQLLDKINGLI